MPEKPVNHVCTSALLCPLYLVLEGLSGLSVQLAGSVLGVTVNLLLLLGNDNNQEASLAMFSLQELYTIWLGPCSCGWSAIPSPFAAAFCSSASC